MTFNKKWGAKLLDEHRWHYAGQSAQGLMRGEGTSTTRPGTTRRRGTAAAGKGVASSSHGSKRARRPSEEEHEDVRMAPPTLRRYGLRWVTEKEGKKWFKEHKESKYSYDMFIDRNCLSLVFPQMVDRILTLGLGFVFDAPGDCNLNMVKEFLASWMPKERSNQVKIRGQIIEFASMALNRLLGTPNVNPQPFFVMVKKPPYRNIRHTLCGPNSVARWTRHQQFGYHVLLPYAH
ncbi:hypothetical protein HAX54_036578 [Datura stramonium]|uniref:Uncharacterized protein n=1 Tax=Datura stramonium TaxID=4076 RepID=A0ABS8VK22_DATST|nr:hypothetical protein [Datura stramonium]